MRVRPLRYCAPPAQFTPSHRCGSTDPPALRTQPSYEKARAARTEFPVDDGLAYHQARASRGAGSPARRRDSRPYGAAPRVSCPRQSALQLWVGGDQGVGPSSGILTPLMLGSSCHTDTQGRGQKLTANTKRLSLQPNSSQILAGATFKHSIAGWRALKLGD